MNYFYLFLAFIVITIVIIIVQKKINDNKIKKFVEQDERLKNAKIFDGATNSYVVISENGYIGLKSQLMAEIKVIYIKDLNGFEVRTDGKSSANLGGAVVGGLIFGGAGAIIGGLSSQEKISTLSLVFKVNDFNNPIIEIGMIDSKTKKGTIIYKSAQDKIIKITSLLEIIEKKYKNTKA